MLPCHDLLFCAGQLPEAPSPGAPSPVSRAALAAAMRGLHQEIKRQALGLRPSDPPQPPASPGCRDSAAERSPPAEEELEALRRTKRRRTGA